jgi:glucose-6-phosphate 1-dehydrogenase
MRFQSIDLDFCHSPARGVQVPLSAYENLLLDSLNGDPTFFARADEVEAAWEIVEPIVRHWQTEQPTTFPNYVPGTSGPAAADELLARTGRRWYSAATVQGEHNPDSGGGGLLR